MILLIAATLSWLTAQITKFIIHTLINKKIDLTRIVGDGGMPSSHSATVCSLAAMTFLLYGYNSFEFAISLIFAAIVMHDAMGVRLETGKQAKVIKDIAKIVQDYTELTTNFSEEKLKEFVGHTPLQVIAGAFIGIAASGILYFLVFIN